MNARAVINRMKDGTKLRTDRDLAGLLGVGVSTVSGWQKRESVPLKVLLEFAETNSISLDWLLLGRGPASTIEAVSETGKLIAPSLMMISDETRRLLGVAMWSAAEDLLGRNGGVSS